MKVSIDGKALKDLAKIGALADFLGVPNLKKLTNFHPPYRLCVGKYRVLFDVEDGVLTVYSVKHRKESYY